METLKRSETHTVERHIYRLKKKIFMNVFEDEKFIINNKEGYRICINEKKLYC